MARCQLLLLVLLAEALLRELADCLEQPVARPGPAVPSTDEALVEKRLQDLGVGLADCFRRLVVAAAGEDREAAEQPSLVLVEQVVAPLDRRPEGLLPRIGVAAAFEQVEALPDSFE
jgi:hypothetical protein